MKTKKNLKIIGLSHKYKNGRSIKNFNLDRYSYNHSISDESKFIFIRES